MFSTWETYIFAPVLFWLLWVSFLAFDVAMELKKKCKERGLTPNYKSVFELVVVNLCLMGFMVVVYYVLCFAFCKVSF